MTTLQQDINLRIARIQTAMQAEGIDALIASSNVALLYLFGQIYSGIAYIPKEGKASYLVRRPQQYEDNEQVHYIRKIEELAELVPCQHIHNLALELDELSYNEIQRQTKLCPQAKLSNATSLLRSVRMCKTPYEIATTKQNIQKHIRVYEQVSSVYRQGMTDLDLQIELEYLMRKEGSVGLFRCFGSSMEIHMGSLLVGDNALVASPYDFAMGGAGSDALPLGANGSPLKRGSSIMLDMAGNYGMYLSDITRCYSIGQLSDEAYRLHELSQKMHKDIMQQAKPNTACSELYLHCLELAKEQGASQYFMGFGQQAQFVGHGLGLQINELPVLTARSRDRLQEGMLIAFEPKFVLPGVGPLGVENTYLVTADGVENLSSFDESIIDLETAL